METTKLRLDENSDILAFFDVANQKKKVTHYLPFLKLISHDSLFAC